jgi:aspartate racemase
MKTVGMIGGLGPESTTDYYRLMFAAYRERVKDGSAPPILINSIQMNRVLTLITAKEFQKLTDYLTAELEKLARAGASLGFLSANTPHIVFDDVQRQSPIPLVSIVEAAREAATALGLRKMGLLGTRFTMQGRFYPDVFSKAGIKLVVPSPEEQDCIHEKYMNELVNGMFLAQTREQLLRIVERLKTQEGIDGVILAGTELPLLLRETRSTIPFLDTARIHVDAVIARMLER